MESLWTWRKRRYLYETNKLFFLLLKMAKLCCKLWECTLCAIYERNLQFFSHTFPIFSPPAGRNNHFRITQKRRGGGSFKRQKQTIVVTHTQSEMENNRQKEWIEMQNKRKSCVNASKVTRRLDGGKLFFLFPARNKEIICRICWKVAKFKDVILSPSITPTLLTPFWSLIVYRQCAERFELW